MLWCSGNCLFKIIHCLCLLWNTRIQRISILNTKVVRKTPFIEWYCCMIFGVFFLYESNPPGPLINRLKWFCWKISTCRDIRKLSDSPQTYTVESDSAQANTAQIWTLHSLTLPRSQKIQICGNPKSWLTLHRVPLCADWHWASQTIFWSFRTRESTVG